MKIEKTDSPGIFMASQEINGQYIPAAGNSPEQCIDRWFDKYYWLNDIAKPKQKSLWKSIKQKLGFH